MSQRRVAHIAVRLLLTLGTLACMTIVRPTAAQERERGDRFVRRAGSELRLNGRQFRFAGTNNYYLMYKSRLMVDDVLNAAAANNFSVVRMWGSLDIGNQDGSNSINGKSDGVYFQYWDGTRPAYNDGPDGLERLDYVIARAGRLGLKLVIPFVNNWNAFGGIDQYVRWRDSSSSETRTWYHDDFYTDPAMRSWYKSWIEHLLNRSNTLTGVKYKDDPTIMAWELANEPRCTSAGVYERSSSCTTRTITAWADDVSRFIKRIDKHHLVSAGDEGFYCRPGAADWTENCGEGVDTIALARLPHIDLMSLHLYPDHWGKDAAWGTQWITRHIRDAERINRPVVLGEFGLQDKSKRNVVYKEWTDAFVEKGGDGALYWILSGKQDNGTLYPDYDGFTVYASDPVFITLGNFAQMMRAGRALRFPPVADNDTAVTEFNMPATLEPAANDVAYDRSIVDRASIDLDPSSSGRQTTRSVAGQGTFAVQNTNTVVFTPFDDFAGKASITYTIRDSRGRTSNAATLAVTVKPDPAGAVILYSFETGTEDWAPANWEGDAGTVAQSSAFHTAGAFSLQIAARRSAWFGPSSVTPFDLSDKSRLSFDLQTGSGAVTPKLALQLGPSYTWCEASNLGTVAANTTATMVVDLSALACADDRSDVRGMYVYLDAGTLYIDAVRAE